MTRSSRQDLTGTTDNTGLRRNISRNQRQVIGNPKPFTTELSEVAQILANGILRLKQRETDRQSSALNVSEKGLDVLAKLSVNGDGSAHAVGLIDKREATKR